MRIYLVRHGEVPHNALGQYNTVDEDLTEKGVVQAQELKNLIEKIDYDVVLTSPLIRAQHTAEIVNVKNKEIIIEEELRERSCGDLAGKPLSVTNRDEYWNYNTKIQYGTSEDIRDFFSRIFVFLDKLKQAKYQSVLIVAHSGVSKAFNAYFEGINDGFFLNRGLKNCEIKEYKF